LCQKQLWERLPWYFGQTSSQLNLIENWSSELVKLSKWENKSKHEGHLIDSLLDKWILDPPILIGKIGIAILVVHFVFENIRYYVPNEEKLLTRQHDI